MKYSNYYISNNDGKSNCVIRSFCKIYGDEYDNVYSELCNISEELNCDSFNDIEVFEAYMKRRNTNSIKCDKDIKIKDLKLDDGKYIVFCWDKKDFYHMVPIINNVLYDKDDRSLDLYVISLYKEKGLIKNR